MEKSSHSVLSQDYVGDVVMTSCEVDQAISYAFNSLDYQNIIVSHALHRKNVLLHMVVQYL